MAAAFTSAVQEQIEVGGNKRYVFGTYTNTGGGTGGDVKTGLHVVENFFIQAGGSSALALRSTVNETLPLSGSTDVTIVTNADETGYWIAVGR